MIRRDLRDHARGVHVAAEDLAVQAERDHALLDAGAGALVDADDRAAGLDGEVHHLGDLLAVDLAERAAEDREVLGEHAHLAAVDGAVAGDHAVAVGPVLLQPERRRAVPRQLVELDEGALVEEHARSARGRSCLPLACCFSTAFAEPACTASSRRRSRSASLPAVVWMSMSSGTSVPSPGCCALRSRAWPPRCRLVGQSSAHDRRPRRPPTPRRRPLATRSRLARRGRRRGGLDQRRAGRARPRRRAGEGCVLVAEHQTAGRGRLDRELGDAGAALR